MGTRDFILTLLAVAIGVFVALIVWTLIVKNQVSSSLAGNSTINLLSSLFGTKPATASS
ncbi:MAG: hypothetical protein ABSA45_03235 [Verrucomicrobiota bacterium]|jgi:hypothetical protein